MQRARSRTSIRLLPFFALVACFYAVYPYLVAGAGGAARIFAEQWPIAVTMIAGSYFAGSTPVGGGSVAFPVLVLLLDQPPILGRDFALAIQSLGMTAATVYLLCLRRTVAWRFLAWSVAASAVATPAGCILLARPSPGTPGIPGTWVKLTFAVLWCAFGIFALLRLRRFSMPGEARTPADSPQPLPALAVGTIGGGIVAALLGGGADMVAFCYLVFVRRMDPRIAIPTAMMLMAATSIFGLAATLATGGLAAGTRESWLAAAPIVVLGAPLGALLVGLIPRAFTMGIVGVLCIAQFILAHWMMRSSLVVIAATAGAVGLGLLVLQRLDSTRPARNAR